MTYCGKKIITKSTASGCVEVISHAQNKLGYVVLGRNLNSKRYNLAHRYFWALKNGHPPSDKCLCHKCDNPKCVNVDHLFLGSRVENNIDKCIKDRASSKLTRERVIELRLANGSMSQKKLAKFFKISQSQVSNVFSKNDWSYL